MNVDEVPIEQLVPMKFKSRTTADDPERFNELVESIKEHGILEPIVVKKILDRYEIIAGERRWKAAKAAGLFNVPVNIVDVPEEEAILMQLEENLQRNDLTEEDKTHALNMLAKLKGWNAKQISSAIHKSYTFVTKYLSSEFKDQTKAEAGQQGGIMKANGATQHVAETPSLSICEKCGVGTSEPKPWHGHTLCPQCEKKATLHPEQVDGYFHARNMAKTNGTPKPELLKPRVMDSWENRQARMKPQKSQIELELLEIFSNDDLLRPVQTDRRFPLIEVTPDFVFPRHQLAVFVDGKAVHNHRQDRDEALREQLERRHGFRVLSISYDANTDKTRKEIHEQVRKAV